MTTGLNLIMGIRKTTVGLQLYIIQFLILTLSYINLN